MSRRVAFCALAVTVALHAAEPVRHPFLCTDNGQNKVLALDADGRVIWEYPAPMCQDVWKLPNGHVLLTWTRGIKEVTFDADKKLIWEYRAPAGTEIHNCQPLPDGAVLVAENGTKRLLELGGAGEIRRELPFESVIKGAHGQCRLARRLSNGHTLLCLTQEHLVRELDADGKPVRTIKAPGDVFGAVRLPNGNTLISCGDGHRVIEVDPADKVVWELTENELPGLPLRFVAGLQRLANGNTVVCNWGGHGRVGQQAHIFELTPDKQVVWQVTDNKVFRAVSNIYLLDQPGDPTRFEVLR